MYLKQLFRHNKYWFAVVLLFIFGQLFINFKRGMVFSPFYHYGMYSAVMRPEAQYPVFEVIADGQVLQAKDYTPQQWDKIMQPLLYYSRHREWNENMYRELHRITGMNDSAKYVNHIAKRGFYTWYQQHLARIIDRNIKTMAVQQKNHNPAR